MTADENIATIEGFLRTCESGDFDTLWAYFADDCDYAVLERFGFEKTTDRYRQFMRTFLEAFPDVHQHIEDIIADDTRVWALLTVTGTHLGPLRGMEPTGRSVSYPLIGMYRLRDGKIVKADFLSDELGLAHQLGFA